MDQRDSRILLFALIRSAVFGKRLTSDERTLFSEEMTAGLLSVAHKHDIAHLVALGLEENSMVGSDDKAIKNEIRKAVYRYEQLNYEFESLCKELEVAGIPFMPLKGSVIRKYYKEPWMRTSCDIDILVRREDVDRTASFLTDNCGYTYDGKGSHDISLFSPGGKHIELHYDLVEDGCANSSRKVLKDVWEHAAVREGYRSLYEMTDEMFYFYHIAHMAKHFENGGCGIRPFIDLKILDGVGGADKERRDKLLEEGELLKFADSARKLCAVWFEGKEKDSLCSQMEDYILSGGVYGNIKNRVAVHQQKKGGRVKYAMSRIFLPYDTIKFHYPILERHRWLTPFMEVRRWFKLLFKGKVKQSVRELKYNADISGAEAASIRDFLQRIGL